MNFKPFRDAIESLNGEKFKCNPTPGNLSGLGFSHTVQNDFTVKVNNRQYLVKIKN